MSTQARAGSGTPIRRKQLPGPVEVQTADIQIFLNVFVVLRICDCWFLLSPYTLPSPLLVYRLGAITYNGWQYAGNSFEDGSPVDNADVVTVA